MADRGEVAPFGYSPQKIGFVIALNEDGSPVGQPIPLAQGEGKKRFVPLMNVPQPAKRTSGTSSNFLWDKTSYVLGVTAGEGRRLAQEHVAFKEKHRTAFAGTNDEGLVALLRFLDSWTSDQFEQLGWPEDMKDQNVVFALEHERLRNIYLHNRQTARDLWARLGSESEKGHAACLVTGESSPIARLHPAIKGVWGAQSSGASLVSFNLDAFASYGHEQGENAPVSEAAAFAYTTALNRFLERDSRHRLQVGDASTVFWADASNATSARDAEEVFSAFFSIDEKVEMESIHVIVDKIRDGRPLHTLRPELTEGVRFYVLGLAPNAARLSIRFFVEDDFGQIATHYMRFVEAMRIEPPPRDGHPPIWRMLVETAAQRKSENVPPNLAGEWLRAILTDAPYPLTLLTTILMRLRADHDVNGVRIAMIKSVLIRNFGLEVPVALDQDEDNPAYVLGRLFAVLERIQLLALEKVNATIRDRFFGAASSTPHTVFPLLLRLNIHHQSKAEKDGKKRKAAEFATHDLGKIVEKLGSDFPKSLSIQSQGRFMLGYYHQSTYRKSEDVAAQDSALKGTTPESEEPSA